MRYMIVLLIIIVLRGISALMSLHALGRVTLHPVKWRAVSRLPCHACHVTRALSRVCSHACEVVWRRTGTLYQLVREV